jgi:hypothetical protein
MTYNAKYDYFKDNGIPKVGQTVIVCGYRFKIVSISNLKERAVDYTRTLGKHVEFISADIVVQRDKSIEDKIHRFFLEKGNVKATLV